MELPHYRPAAIKVPVSLHNRPQGENGLIPFYCQMHAPDNARASATTPARALHNHAALIADARSAMPNLRERAQYSLSAAY